MLYLYILYVSLLVYSCLGAFDFNGQGFGAKCKKFKCEDPDEAAVQQNPFQPVSLGCHDITGSSGLNNFNVGGLQAIDDKMESCCGLFLSLLFSLSHTHTHTLIVHNNEKYIMSKICMY